MERINRLRLHLAASPAPRSSPTTLVSDVFLAPPSGDRAVYDAVLTPEAVAFVAELAAVFQTDVEKLHQARTARRVQIEQGNWRPDFLEDTREIREDSWTIDWVPEVLRDRRVDVGDVSPAKTELLLRALNSGAQGVQVDFDDGHCPTWTNTLMGHKNVAEAARGQLQVPSAGLKLVQDPALLIVRPRAWNMDEPNMLVNGVVVPGAIFDFAMHFFHNGRVLLDKGTGPFLYLPKLEGYREARLWERIFLYSEQRLGMSRGSIKATVLIENIFAAFEMDEILYTLRHYSSGLNCGMWDYTASIVVNFCNSREFVLPDRQQYVSMKSEFLRSYMELLIETCKRRSAPATTGMVPFVLSQLPASLSEEVAIERAKEAKRLEALAGSDGALVYDLKLVKPIQEVFAEVAKVKLSQQSGIQSTFDRPSANKKNLRQQLLSVPTGRVTRQSVDANIRVVLSYVLEWLSGNGTAVVNGCVEDSATAEISRAQLWQWIHHQTPLEDDISGTKQPVTAGLVLGMLNAVADESPVQHRYPPRYIKAAGALVLQLATMRSPPSFITTFLLENDAVAKAIAK